MTHQAALDLLDRIRERWGSVEALREAIDQELEECARRWPEYVGHAVRKVKDDD